MSPPAPKNVLVNLVIYTDLVSISRFPITNNVFPLMLAFVSSHESSFCCIYVALEAVEEIRIALLSSLLWQ